MTELEPYTVLHAVNIKTGAKIEGVISNDRITLRIDVFDDLEFYRAIEPAGYMVVTEGTNHMQNFTPLAVGDFDELVDQMPQAHDWFIDQCAAARKVFD